MSQTVTVATFNVNGLLALFQPLATHEKLAPYTERHTEICRWFEASGVDIINFQEVFTYRNLQLLRRNLPSYPYLSYRPFIFGPRGALVTFSKIPLHPASYASFLGPSLNVRRAGLPKGSLLRSSLKGVLVSRAAGLPLAVINTHLLYNAHFNWRSDGKFYDIQRAQLDKVAEIVRKEISGRPETTLIVSGDLNVEAGSELADYFLEKTELYDFFAADTAPTFHNEYVAPPGFKYRIDYLLANQALAGNAERVIVNKLQLPGGASHASDHIGLQAQIKLRS